MKSLFDCPEDVTIILYDGECPFCKNYVKFVNLQRNLKSVELINARDEIIDLDELDKKGIQLDDGMVVYHEGSLYHGSDAMYILSKLAEDKTLFHKFHRVLFSKKDRSEIIYPFLRAIRNATLFLLGKKKLKSGDN